MTVFVGDDWAEDHHDVHLMSSDGVRGLLTNGAKVAEYCASNAS